MESNRVTEDSGTKEEVEFSDWEDPETSGGVKGADQSLQYIVHLANMVKLYQKKKWNCFGCGSPDHLLKDCLKDLSKTAQKVSLNAKEGMVKKRRSNPSGTSCCATNIPREGYQNLRMFQKFPFLNPDPFTQWSGPRNIARVQIDGESTWALLNSGSTINAVTPRFDGGSFFGCWPLLDDLMDGTQGINGFWGVFSQPLGYIIVRLQMEGVWGYNEDQVP